MSKTPSKTPSKAPPKSKGKTRARRGLGRGLDALLGPEAKKPAAPQENAEAVVTEKVVEKVVVKEEVVVKATTTLKIDELEPNRFQPRTEFDETGLNDLAESIKAQGVVQPIVVTPKKDGDASFGVGYIIIAGERRWRAARRAELEEVPVVIREVDDDQQLLELALVENIQRADLNPVEEAEAYRILADKFDLSQDEIATRVGKARTTVTNFLRLLRLPDEVQDLLRTGKLTAGQARPLIPITDKKRQVELARQAVEEGLTARKLEALANADQEKKPKPEKKAPEEPDVHTRSAMDKLTTNLQTRVEIIRKKKGGHVRIFFHSEDELIRLYDRLMEGE